MYLVSACLCGINCKYHGGNNTIDTLKELLAEGKVMPICPEVLGGLSTPRLPCEILLDEDGTKRVINNAGFDVTNEFVQGAEKTLAIAKVLGAEIAILKAKSPSCGFGTIYDGSFSGKTIDGNGITAELLEKNGIKIFNEHNFPSL